MQKIKRGYTPEQAQKVIELFYRPLRPGEEIVNNTNGAIAKEVGIKESAASQIINKHLDEKFRILNFKINNT